MNKRKILIYLYLVLFRISVKATLIKPAWKFLMIIEKFTSGGLYRGDIDQFRKDFNKFWGE